MNDILIITAQDIKEDAAVSQHVDPQLIEPFIGSSQVFHIQPVLGDALYSEIIDAISGDTLSGDNYTLVENYIRPALVNYSFYEAVPFIWMRVESKGVTLKFSDNSQSATDKQINYFRQNVLDIAVSYKNRMIDYLNDNADKFPNWRSDCGGRSKGNSSGIFLG